MKSLVILAGGKSSRMGQDKVLLDLGGITFIERIFSNALICFDRIIISTDSMEHADEIKNLGKFQEFLQDPAKYDREKYIEFVIDNYSAIGPLGGILSVFEKTDVDRFSIISVDVPLADMNVLEMLYDSCRRKAVFLKLGQKKAEPLIAAYDRSAEQDIRNAVDAGNFKIRLAIGNEDLDIINTDTFEDKQATERLLMAFRNFNTPEEYGEVVAEIGNR